MQISTKNLVQIIFQKYWQLSRSILEPFAACLYLQNPYDRFWFQVSY